jgi:1-acyl-sn-glycerol-3-phosphate acyltransferase
VCKDLNNLKLKLLFIFVAFGRAALRRAGFLLLWYSGLRGANEGIYMQQYFEGDGYNTPPDIGRDFADRLLLGTRVWFHYLCLRVEADARAYARRREYGPENFAVTSWAMLRNIERCGGRIEISGLDHIRSAVPPFVFVGNHMSAIETFLLPVMILPFADVTFIVKESLLRHFYFGPIMRACRPIAVGRENAREDLVRVLTEGKRILGEGRSLIVFPQSTRSRVFDPATFNTLGAKLAERARVPLIPVALKTDFWEHGRFVRDLGPIHRDRIVHFEFSRPIKPGFAARDAHQKALDFITERLLSWGGEARNAED